MRRWHDKPFLGCFNSTLTRKRRHIRFESFRYAIPLVKNCPCWGGSLLVRVAVWQVRGLGEEACETGHFARTLPGLKKCLRKESTGADYVSFLQVGHPLDSFRGSWPLTFKLFTHNYSFNNRIYLGIEIFLFIVFGYSFSSTLSSSAFLIGISWLYVVRFLSAKECHGIKGGRGEGMHCISTPFVPCGFSADFVVRCILIHLRLSTRRFSLKLNWAPPEILK
jgi:hypothetical protein